MVLGNGALALLLVPIVHQSPWRFSRVDAAYWTTVLLLLAARSADARWLDGRTAEGDPVTPAHLRRYCVSLIAASATAWICAQAVQL
jgi:hypothetical protein